MTILIIGSEGFIGKNLAEYYRLKGDLVFKADIVSSNADHYTQLGTTDNPFEELVRLCSADICINSSGQSDIQNSYEDPARDYELNTENVRKMLDAILKHRPSCRFINFSSAAVYGNNKNEKQHEKDPCNPVSPYGKHKLKAENLCRKYAEQNGLKTCSLRLFSVYGEQQKKLLFWDLWNKYLQDAQQITLFGSGNEKRDFIYIRDLVSAVDTIVNNGSFNGESINIGNGKAITIEEAAHCFFKLMENPVDLQFSLKLKQGDPDSLVADNAELTGLGYSQHFSLEQGLNNYIRWLKEKK